MAPNEENEWCFIIIKREFNDDKECEKTSVKKSTN